MENELSPDIERLLDRTVAYHSTMLSPRETPEGIVIWRAPVTTTSKSAVHS
jgi:hypothetical protein